MKRTNLFTPLTLITMGLMAIPMQASAYMDGPPDLEIQILCAQSESCSQQGTYPGVTVQGPKSGTTSDGTIFQADPNPTVPATGTGVFEPFVRIQRGTGIGSGDQQEVWVPKNGGGFKTELWNSENGFNSNAPQTDINYDTKDGLWTYAVQWGDIDTSDGNIVLQLDANQNGSSNSETNQILITDMQIFIGSDPNFANPEATNTGDEGTGYTGTPFDAQNYANNTLLGQSANWSLDNATNGDVDIRLQASICDSNGQCGSGHGDLTVFIPLASVVGSGSFKATDYFVFYSEYLKPNDGFEEWRLRTSDGFVPPSGSVPEPSALALIGFGMLGMFGYSRRKLKQT